LTDDEEKELRALCRQNKIKVKVQRDKYLADLALAAFKHDHDDDDYKLYRAAKRSLDVVTDNFKFAMFLKMRFGRNADMTQLKVA
jgi:hypothetical protein